MIRDRHHFHFFRRACSVLTCVFLFSCLLTQRVYAQEETEEETFTSEKVGEGVYYTLYENSDGTSTLDYYAGPIRYEDEDSELHDIDLSLVSKGEDSYTAASTKARISFPESLNDENGISLSSGGKTILMSPFSDADEEGQEDGRSAMSLEREDVSRNAITYRDESSDAEYRYYAGNMGVKEEIILDGKPLSNVFSFSVSVNEGHFELCSDGSVAIGDDEGSFAYIKAPSLTDAEGRTDYGNAAYGISEDQGRNGIILSLTIDEDYLDACSYPLRIDPTLQFIDENEVYDAYVRSQSPNQNYYNSATLSMPFGSEADGSVSRTYVYFEGLQEFISGITVSNAVFNAYLETVPSVSSTVEIHSPESPWSPSAITWNSQPLFSSVVYASKACGSTAHAKKDFNITSLVQAWAQGLKDNYGIVLKSDSESSGTYGSFYGSRQSEYENEKPYLSITYTAPISAPTQISVTKINEMQNSGTADLSISFRKVNNATGYKLKITGDNGTIIQRTLTGELSTDGNTKTWNSTGKTVFAGYTGFPNDAAVVLGGTTNRYYIAVGAYNANSTTYSEYTEVVFSDTTPPNAVSGSILVSQTVTNGSTDVDVTFDQISDLPLHGASGIDHYLVRLCGPGGLMIAQQEVEPDTSVSSLSCIFTVENGQNNAYAEIKAFDSNGNSPAIYTRSASFNIIDAASPSRPAVSLNAATWSNSSSVTLSWSGVYDPTDADPNVYYRLYQTQNGSAVMIKGETQIGCGSSGIGSIVVSPYNDGMIDIEVYAKDMDGNASESSWTSYYKDTGSPTVDISPANGSLTGEYVIFSGSIADGCELASWSIEHESAPGIRTTVAQGSEPVEGIIAVFDAGSIPANTVLSFRITAQDSAGNETETVRTYTKGSGSLYVDPQFSISKATVTGGIWYMQSQVNAITLSGTVPQGTAKLIVDQKAMPLSSEIDIDDLSDSSDGSVHFPYVRISDSTDDYYSVPVYGCAEQAQETVPASNPPSAGSGTYVATVPDNGDIDRFRISVSLSASFLQQYGSSAIGCYVAKGNGSFVSIVPDTDYYVDVLFNNGNGQNPLSDSEGLYTIKITYPVSGDPAELSGPIDSVTLTSVKLVKLDADHFRIRTVDVPQNLCVQGSSFFLVPLKWDGIADQSALYSVYRAPYGTGDYRQIASGIADSYYYDREIEYGRQFSYYVTANRNGRESAPSNTVSAWFAQENEVSKHLGLEENYRYQSFSDGYGNGYVELHDGNLVYSVTDGRVDSSLFSLVARRTYNSRSTSRTILGYGWDLSFNTSIMVEYSGGEEQAVLLKDGDGSFHRFEKTNSGYDSPIGETLSLVYDTDHFTVERDDGVSYVFDTLNRLYQMRSRSGDCITFYYNGRGNISRVSNSSGQEIAFTYYSQSDKLDLLYRLSFPDNTVVEYDYSGGRLISVTESLTTYTAGTANGALAVTSSYAYTDGLLSLLQVPGAGGGNNLTELEFAYDGDRIAEILFPDDQKMEFGYQGLSRTVSSRIGEAVFSTSSLQYGNDGLCANTTDSLGNTIYYAYDAAQNITSICYDEQYYDSGGTIQSRQICYGFEYDSLHNLISATDPMGNETEYVYADSHNPYSVTRSIIPQNEQSDIITDYTYDSQTGNLLSTSDALSRIAEFEYDTQKPYLLTSSTDEYGSETTYQYDAYGRVVSSSLELDSETYITSTIGLYDPMGRPLQTSDPKGNSSYFQYDEKGNIVTYRDVSRFTFYEYYPNSTVKRVTDNLGTYTTYYYDSRNRPVRITVNQSTNELNHETLYSYEYVTLNGSLVYKVTASEKEGNNTVVSCIDYFNSAGELIREEKEGKTTVAEYNARGDVMKITGSNGTSVLYSYDPNGNVLKTIVKGTSNGTISTESAYDYVGNVISSTDGNGNVTTYRYDLLNRLTALIEGNGSVTTTYSYGNTAVSDRILNYYTDPNGLVYETYIDRAGRTVRERRVGSDSLSMQTRYSYDANSNLLALTNNDDSQILYTYDAYDQLLRETRSDSYTAYTYDGIGRLTAMADYDGNDTLIYGTDVSYSYDSLGRAVQYVQSGEAIDYAYTPTGLVESISYGNHSNTAISSTGKEIIRYSYDSDSRLSSIYLDQTDSNDQLINEYQVAVYTYNSNGTLKKRKIYRNFLNASATNVTASYSYDEFGRTKQIGYSDTGNDRELYTYTYDSNSNIVKEIINSDYLNKVIVNRYTYDSLNRLIQAVQSCDMNSTTSYLYDDAGNRIQKTKDSLVTTYTYNSLNQLTSSTEEVKYKSRTYNVSSTYTYSANGSLSSVSETGRPVSSYQETSQYYPQGFTLVGDFLLDTDTSYIYDDRQRLIETQRSADLSGTMTSYTVNGSSHNKTLQIDDTISSSEGTYTYDGSGRRTARTVSTLFYDITEDQVSTYAASITRKYCYTGDAILFESDSSGNKLIENIPDPEGTTLMSYRYTSSNTSDWFTMNTDIRGSITSIIKHNGYKANNYVYDEYGNIIIVSSSTFFNEETYTGAKLDTDTGLYYMNARYYDPSLGVFLSNDTYKGSIYSSITHNLYSYAGNNPVSFIDPTGHYLVSVIDGETGTGTVTPEPAKGGNGPEISVNPYPYSNGPYGVPSYAISSGITLRETISNEKYDYVIGNYSFSSLDLVSEAFSLGVDILIFYGALSSGAVIYPIVFGVAADFYQQVVRGENPVNAAAKSGVHAAIGEGVEKTMNQTISLLRNAFFLTSYSTPSLLSAIVSDIGEIAITNILYNVFDERVKNIQLSYDFDYYDPVYKSSYGY